jgi:hypothetical protein
VNDQCRVKSSGATGAPVATRLAAVLVECHMVFEVLEPDEGL